MAFQLPRLQDSIEVVSETRRPSLTFQTWWQEVVTRIESTVNGILANTTSIEGLQVDKQDQSDLLDGLSGLDTTLGLVEQIGDTAFSKRAIGVATDADIPTVGDADDRYLKPDSAPTVSAAGTTHKVAVTIGGSTYYVLLSNV